MKRDFGHFHDFGTSEGLDIAYHDSAKCFLTFGYDIAHAGSFKNHKNAFLNDPKSQKVGFWSFFGLGSVGST